VKEFTTDQLRTRVGLLTQDGYVFDSTIEENLRIGRQDATTSELEQALGRSRLLDWVQQLPEGLATLVGEHGSQLSGGQRQRLCLARLLLADFSVVVFDEPGEHLDTDTAAELMADLLRVTTGRTSVLITHRLSGLEQVEQIVVMGDGRIQERGTHSELLAQGGWYATNWTFEQAAAVSLG
jgi:ATP-binding cassette subfamily C protein CydCD